MHEEIKAWEKRVDDMCADLPDRPVHEEPDDLLSHTSYTCNELELEIGHKLIAGEITIEEAYDALGVSPE